jgi:hypothetical protein
VALIVIPILSAQIMEGELRVTIRDQTGRGVAGRIELAGRNPQFRTEAQADSAGRVRLLRLPQGIYRLAVTHDGFEPFSDTIEIRSAVPQEREVILKVGAVATEITVEANAPLLDRSEPGLVMQGGREQLDETPGTTLGRSTIDVVTTMPGWLLEANAVLHPRGSEYDTQYVIDGMPLYDNRSIGFCAGIREQRVRGSQHHDGRHRARIRPAPRRCDRAGHTADQPAWACL